MREINMVEGDSRISLALADGHNIKPALEDFIVRAGFQVELKQNGTIHAEVKDDPLLGSITYNSSRDIPLRLVEGVNQFGALGRDEEREAQLAGMELEEVVALGISICRVVLEVPIGSRYKSPGELNGARIATRFRNMTVKYFSEHDAKVRIVPYSGKEEGAVLAGAADAVVADYVSGGTAFRHGLKALPPLRESTLLKSEAVLVAYKRFLDEHGSDVIVSQFIDRFRKAVKNRHTALNGSEASDGQDFDRSSTPLGIAVTGEQVYPRPIIFIA